MKQHRQLIFDILFGAYLAVLLRITVFRDGCFSNGLFTGRVEWVPFVYLAKLIRVHYWRYFIYLFVGNLVWFVPLGAYLRHREMRWPLVILCGMGLSLLIEITQFVLGSGVTEVEDVILNTAGTAIGCGLAAIVLRCRRKKT